MFRSASLSRLQAAFSVTWDVSERPAYSIHVRHEFELGGFEITQAPSIQLDEVGLEWMRRIDLTHKRDKVGYRMIVFNDLNVIIPNFPGPSPEMLEKMYGNSRK